MEVKIDSGTIRRCPSTPARARQSAQTVILTTPDWPEKRRKTLACLRARQSAQTVILTTPDWTDKRRKTLA
jgi:hypothetical protein